MKIILDTHTFLWFIEGDNQLSERAKKLIEDTKNVKILSVASVWEMSIKVSIGKLVVLPSFEERIPEQLRVNGIILMPLDLPHFIRVSKLPFSAEHHKDPFDRMIIAQSLAENISVVSCDSAFDNYGVKRLWN